MNSCDGCSCVENYNDQSTFCGKVVNKDKSSTVFGCETDCCKDCPLKKKVEPKKNSLTKKDFLKFLKRQRAKNTLEGILPPIAPDEPIAEPVEEQHNNANANHDNLNTVPFRKEECTSDEGYVWNSEDLVCDELTVKFYSNEGESGSHFELKKGNYDENEIKEFDFKPSYMAVPLGLRVKIWTKSGFVGPSSGYLGNNSKNLSKKNLFPVKNLGSIQICNMKTCVKPNGYDDMTLISLIDGNNIDFVENNVSDLGEYKERLREKIHKKLMDIRFTHKDCLNLVSEYLTSKEIDISDDISEISNAFSLQKMLYELTELPSCQNLIHLKSNKVLSPNESFIEKEEDMILNTVGNLVEKIAPAPTPIKLNTNKNVESKFESNNISFVIFIFVFLLITLLVSALIYFYIQPK